MTTTFTRSLTAAIVLSSALVALPALADTPATLKSGTSPVVAAPVSRVATRRVVRPIASVPHRIVVADASAAVRTRYSTIMILGVGY